MPSLASEAWHARYPLRKPRTRQQQQKLRSATSTRRQEKYGLVGSLPHRLLHHRRPWKVHTPEDIVGNLARLEDLPIFEVKRELRRRGCRTDGLKPALLRRLRWAVRRGSRSVRLEARPRAAPIIVNGTPPAPAREAALDLQVHNAGLHRVVSLAPRPAHPAMGTFAGAIAQARHDAAVAQKDVLLFPLPPRSGACVAPGEVSPALHVRGAAGTAAAVSAADALAAAGAGRYATCPRRARTVAWGWAGEGRLGLGSLSRRLPNAVTSDGRGAVIGEHDGGALARVQLKATPMAGVGAGIGPGAATMDAAAGAAHSLLLTRAGAVLSCGDGKYGQLGAARVQYRLKAAPWRLSSLLTRPSVLPAPGRRGDGVAAGDEGAMDVAFMPATSLPLDACVLVMFPPGFRLKEGEARQTVGAPPMRVLSVSRGVTGTFTAEALPGGNVYGPMRQSAVLLLCRRDKTGVGKRGLQRPIAAGVRVSVRVTGVINPVVVGPTGPFPLLQTRSFSSGFAPTQLRRARLLRAETGLEPGLDVFGGGVLEEASDRCSAALWGMGGGTVRANERVASRLLAAGISVGTALPEPGTLSLANASADVDADGSADDLNDKRGSAPWEVRCEEGIEGMKMPLARDCVPAFELWSDGDGSDGESGDGSDETDGDCDTDVVGGEPYALGESAQHAYGPLPEGLHAQMPGESGRPASAAGAPTAVGAAPRVAQVVAASHSSFARAANGDEAVQACVGLRATITRLERVIAAAEGKAGCGKWEEERTQWEQRLEAEAAAMDEAQLAVSDDGSDAEERRRAEREADRRRRKRKRVRLRRLRNQREYRAYRRAVMEGGGDDSGGIATANARSEAAAAAVWPSRRARASELCDSTDHATASLRRWRSALRQHEWRLRDEHRGSLMAWGRNEYGQLGLGDRQDRHTPQPVRFCVPGAAPSTPSVQLAHVSAGQTHVLALDTRGSLWVWGNAENGRLGLGDTQCRLAPQRMPRKLFANDGVEAAEEANGGWREAEEPLGWVEGRQAGYARADPSVETAGAWLRVTHIAAGYASSYAVIEAPPGAASAAGGGVGGGDTQPYQRVFVWGHAGDCRLARPMEPLGDAMFPQRARAVEQALSSAGGTLNAEACERAAQGGRGIGEFKSRRIVRIAAGSAHVLLLTERALVVDTPAYRLSRRATELWSWGRNNEGQLGCGERSSGYGWGEQKGTLQRVRFLDQDWRRLVWIGCGRHTSFALTMQGQLYSWGYGGFGEHGHGDVRYRVGPTLVNVGGGTGRKGGVAAAEGDEEPLVVHTVAPGKYHALALGARLPRDFDGTGTFDKPEHTEGGSGGKSATRVVRAAETMDPNSGRFDRFQALERAKDAANCLGDDATAVHRGIPRTECDLFRSWGSPLHPQRAATPQRYALRHERRARGLRARAQPGATFAVPAGEAAPPARFFSVPSAGYACVCQRCASELQRDAECEGVWCQVGLAAAELPPELAAAAAGTAAAAHGSGIAVPCERCLEQLPRSLSAPLLPPRPHSAAANASTAEQADEIDGGVDGGFAGGYGFRSGWWGGLRYPLDDGTGGFDGDDCVGGKDAGALPHAAPARGPPRAFAAGRAAQINHTTHEHGGGVPTAAELAVRRRRVPLCPIAEEAGELDAWEAALVLQCATRAWWARDVTQFRRATRLLAARHFWQYDVWPVAARAACAAVEARVMEQEHWRALAVREEELQRVEDERLRRLVRDRREMLAEDALTRLSMSVGLGAKRCAGWERIEMEKAELERAQVLAAEAKAEAVAKEQAQAAAVAADTAASGAETAAAMHEAEDMDAEADGALDPLADEGEEEDAGADKEEEDAIKRTARRALRRRRFSLAAHCFRFDGWRQDRIRERGGLELGIAMCEDWEIHQDHYPHASADSARRSLPLREFQIQVVSALNVQQRDKVEIAPTATASAEGGGEAPKPKAKGGRSGPHGLNVYCSVYWQGVLRAETPVVPHSADPVFPFADEVSFTLPCVLANADLLLELWDRRREGDEPGDEFEGLQPLEGETPEELGVREEAEKERRRLARRPGRGLGAGDQSLGCVPLRGVKLLQFNADQTPADIARLAAVGSNASNAEVFDEPLVLSDTWERSLVASKLGSAKQPVGGVLKFKLWEVTTPAETMVPLEVHQRHLAYRDTRRRLSMDVFPPNPPFEVRKVQPEQMAAARKREWVLERGPELVGKRKKKKTKKKDKGAAKKGGKSKKKRRG